MKANSQDCNDVVILVDSVSLTCTASSGTGKDLSVVVTTAGQDSPGVNQFSYSGMREKKIFELFRLLSLSSKCIIGLSNWNEWRPTFILPAFVMISLPLVAEEEARGGRIVWDANMDGCVGLKVPSGEFATLRAVRAA